MHNLALGAVAGAVVTWAFSNIAIKAISTTGLLASFYRLWFAIPLLWLVVALVPSLRRRLNRRWLSASLLGGSLFAVHQVFFFNGLKLTSVANLTIIGALQPALVLLVAGRMFGERVTLREIGWSLVALTGVIIVIIGSTGRPGWSPLGDVLAVGNLFAFSAYFLASKKIRAQVGATEYVAGMTTVAGVWIFAASLITAQEFASPSGWEWLILLLLAIFPGTIGHFLTNWAHAHTSAFVVSIMLLAVPVLATGGAVLVLDETLGITQIVGGVMVLVAIGIIVRSTRARTGGQLAESVAETDAP